MTDPEKIRQLLDRGLTAYGVGNVDEALEAWRNVLSLDPGNSKAKEYIRFVEESWGPRQERMGMPYRPDEDSGEIPKIEELTAAVPSEEPAAEAVSDEEPVGDIDISVEVPIDEGGFETGAFTPPAKPIMQEEQWRDLYDFGNKKETNGEAETAPQPAAPPPPEPAPVVEEEPVAEPAQGPAQGQEKITPLAGDWSDVLTQEEKAEQQPEGGSSSTLPPHPGEVQSIEIIEEMEPEAKPPAPRAPAPKAPEAAAGDGTMQRDELASTKKYDSVPTVVRPPGETIPPEAVPSEPRLEVEALPPPEELARDSFDRFPMDPELPIELEPLEPEADSGKAFYQVPRPETTPPLGSLIVRPDESDLLDLVAGSEGSAVEAGAVPGISAASEVDSLLKGAKDMLELDDFSGAIDLLDKVLEQELGNAEARKMRTEAEQELLSMLSSKLGDLNRTPRVRMSQDEVIWLNLDNRAGFVLSLVDGTLSLDEIVSVCGLPQLEGMRILVQLLQEKVIEIN